MPSVFLQIKLINQTNLDAGLSSNELVKVDWLCYLRILFCSTVLNMTLVSFFHFPTSELKSSIRYKCRLSLYEQVRLDWLSQYESLIGNMIYFSLET